MLFATVAGANAQLQGDTYAFAKQKGEARVVYSYNETPGFVTKDADGNMHGLCIDLMKAFGLWLKKELYPSLSIQSVNSGKDALQLVANNPKLFTQLDFLSTI